MSKPRAKTSAPAPAKKRPAKSRAHEPAPGEGLERLKRAAQIYDEGKRRAMENLEAKLAPAIAALSEYSKVFDPGDAYKELPGAALAPAAATPQPPNDDNPQAAPAPARGKTPAPANAVAFDAPAIQMTAADIANKDAKRKTGRPHGKSDKIKNRDFADACNVSLRTVATWNKNLRRAREKAEARGNSPAQVMNIGIPITHPKSHEKGYFYGLDQPLDDERKSPLTFARWYNPPKR